MKEVLHLSLALGLICAIASGVLAFANKTTADAQDRADMAERQDALSRVLPEYDNQPLVDRMDVRVADETFAIYPARRSGRLVAVAVEGTTTTGFGGRLRVLVGLETDGAIRTLVVTEHKETPGLGTQATDRKAQRSIWQLFSRPSPAAGTGPGLPPCPYLDQYAGLAADTAPFRVRQDGGDCQSVSGATVTSRAVADAVSRACQAFVTHREAIGAGG